ncbi:MAG: hypothetical protein MOGMAGMI_01513 [Candidatus Omnitrophica bacterium]|nr:hypothetical protein [Candidatus Omnitrophota bacterium]
MNLTWEPTMLSGAADILILALLIYTALVLVKRTRAAFVLIGILIMGVVYVLARQFQLWMTAAVFQAFFTVILIAAVVLFQEELRHFFEQVALWGLHPGRRRSTGDRSPDAVLLARTLADLARERVGALVVLRGNDLLSRHLTGGVELGGRLSEPLIKSLFEPTSPSHDGAIVIEDGRVTLFSAHLPLSKSLSQLDRSGTRHAAALGLSEVSDALCLVVSEEKGTLSMAEAGRIERAEDASVLERRIRAHLERVRPEDPRSAFAGFVRRNWAEKMLALVLSSSLWFVNVHGAGIVQRTYVIPAARLELPPALKGATILPERVDVTLSGPRKEFYFLSAEDIRVRVHAQHVRRRTGTLTLGPADFALPESLQIADIAPTELTYHLESRRPATTRIDGKA